MHRPTCNSAIGGAVAMLMLVASDPLERVPLNRVYGQLSAFQPAAPSPIYQAPQSYADFFNEQARNYNAPQANITNYTINRYFYHRPTLSPYLNLTRRTTGDTLNNYYRWVLPEVDRRNEAAAASRTRMTVQEPVLPGPPPISSGHLPQQNPYFNQYYNFGGVPTASAPKLTPLPKLVP